MDLGRTWINPTVRSFVVPRINGQLVRADPFRRDLLLFLRRRWRRKQRRQRRGAIKSHDRESHGLCEAMVACGQHHERQSEDLEHCRHGPCLTRNDRGSCPTEMKKGPMAPFSFLAEREGFEPSIEFLTLYSLSRGAPSASRAPLRYSLSIRRQSPLRFHPWSVAVRHPASPSVGCRRLRPLAGEPLRPLGHLSRFLELARRSNHRTQIIRGREG